MRGFTNVCTIINCHMVFHSNSLQVFFSAAKNFADVKRNGRGVSAAWFGKTTRTSARMLRVLRLSLTISNVGFEWIFV